MWRCVLAGLFLVCCKSESLLDGATAPSEPVFGPYCHDLGVYTETPPLTGVTSSPVRPTHTFSIVARDPVTGDLGVAVQSHWFNVGAVVTWAEAGVGAVASQAMAEPSYGAKGLALMRSGMSAPDALMTLSAQDKEQQSRQVGMVDATGQAASRTGTQCIAHADSYATKGLAIQANIMANGLVVPAMAHAYASAKGDLADRMLAALEAAQEVGGDIRGCQSAAILIVSGKRSAEPWKEKKLDLRVEDHASPIVELRRLVGLARAYEQANLGDELATKGDVAGASAAYARATALYPQSVELAFWQGVTWATRGDFARSTPLLRQAFQEDPAWIELVRRLPAAKLIPDATAEQAISEAQKN